jgi:hypothetical protein
MSNLQNLKYSISILIKDTMESGVTAEEMVLMLESITDDLRHDPNPNGVSDEPDPGDMDGDHESSMRSVGWGMDED